MGPPGPASTAGPRRVFFSQSYPIPSPAPAALAPYLPSAVDRPLLHTVPAGLMLGLHALALAHATGLPPAQNIEIWIGYHIAAAVLQVAALSLGLRGEDPSARPPRWLWAAPALDLLATLALAIALRPF